MGLAKTRLEGLAYSTVTTLLMNTALVLFSSTKKKETFDKDGDGKNVANSVSRSKALAFEEFVDKIIFLLIFITHLIYKKNILIFKSMI